MLISEKTTGSIYLFIYLFIASKEAYPIVRQLGEKKTVKKSQAKVVKCAKNKYWVPIGTPTSPLGHLSVKAIIHMWLTCIGWRLQTLKL